MLSGLLKNIVDIVYPKACLACGNRLKNQASVEGLICAQCWGKIKKNPPPFCHSCGRNLKSAHYTKNLCPTCVKTNLHFNRAFSPCVYDGVMKDLIHAFKYQGKDHLGKSLSSLMINFIKEFKLPIDCVDYIVPVPLHESRLREREFNQAEILSRHIATEFNKKKIDVLCRKHATLTQTGLGVNERFKNVRGSFIASERLPIKDKNILLVDDVLTTGATASEAACALKDNGANIIFVLTLAN